MADTQLILHVEGEKTAAIPKRIVRAGIAQGQIKYSQLVWSPIHTAWKQIRELPHLWPSQKIAPPPPARPNPPMAVSVAPRVAAGPILAPRAVPSVKVSAPPKVPVLAGESVGAVPRARVSPSFAAPATPVVARGNDTAGRIAKWLSFGVGGLLLLAVGVNAVLIDRPLAGNLQISTFKNVPVFAHLGAFIQPADLVIHVPKSAAINRDNLAQFLSTLAHCTPPRPFTQEPFDRVSIGSGWAGRFSFPGAAWTDLGKLTDSPYEQQDFILSEVDDASGQPLAPAGVTSEVRDQAWAALLREFTKPGATPSPTDTSP
jgi:hypothetical protein